MDGEYIKVDRLVTFIKQNGYVYANSLYEMGEDAVSREEYNRVLKQRDIAVKYLNNLRPDEPCLFRVYGAKEGYCGTNECEHARKLKKMEEAT